MRPRRPGGFDGRFPRDKPLPPPPDGVKAKLARKYVPQWWAKRWIAALEHLSRDFESRLGRGRTYARAGRASELEVRPGLVTAQVTGSRPTPYRVRIALTALDDAAWKRVIAAMGAQARFSAELLAGRMPETIEEAFATAGTTLFPKAAGDLVTDCSCPDWANPCKHISAVCYVLGEAFDKDPFLLFELRGRTRTALLEALHATRGGKPHKKSTTTERTAGVSLRKIAAADYDRPKAPLPTLHLDVEPPSASGALLEGLGKPASWSADRSPAEVLAPRVRAAAEQARKVALAEAPTESHRNSKGGRS